MQDRDFMRNAIAGAIGALRRGDELHALNLFGRLAESEDRPVRRGVLELADANVDMLRTLTGHGREDDLLFTVDADGPGSEHDGDGGGSIDDAAPAQRATARILLALANGYPDDADTQLDIVAEAEVHDPDSTGQVFAYMMGWTLELIDLCEDTGRPVPQWLAPVLAGR